MESDVGVVLIMNINSIINSAIHDDSFSSSNPANGDNVEDTSWIVVDTISVKR